MPIEAFVLCIVCEQRESIDKRNRHRQRLNCQGLGIHRIPLSPMEYDLHQLIFLRQTITRSSQYSYVRVPIYSAVYVWFVITAFDTTTVSETFSSYVCNCWFFSFFAVCCSPSFFCSFLLASVRYVLSFHSVSVCVCMIADPDFAFYSFHTRCDRVLFFSPTLIIVRICYIGVLYCFRRLIHTFIALNTFEYVLFDSLYLEIGFLDVRFFFTTFALSFSIRLKFGGVCVFVRARFFFISYLLLYFILFHSFPLHSISNARIHLLLAFCF